MILRHNIGRVNLPPFSYFDRIVVLNLKSRPDRKVEIEQELKYQKIKEVKFFEGIEGGIKGFNQSMYDILKENQDVDKLLILEDDCYFFIGHKLSKAIEQLPNDWDILSMGSNLQSDHYKFSDNLYWLKDGWMTHAMAYSKKMIQVILREYDKELVFDDWLRINIYPRFKCFMTNPISAWQRPSRSDLQCIESDYLKIYGVSRNYMK